MRRRALVADGTELWQDNLVLADKAHGTVRQVGLSASREDGLAVVVARGLVALVRRRLVEIRATGRLHLLAEVPCRLVRLLGVVERQGIEVIVVQPRVRFLPFPEARVHELVAPLAHGIEDGEIAFCFRQAQASPGDELVVVPSARVDVAVDDAHLLARRVYPQLQAVVERELRHRWKDDGAFLPVLGFLGFRALHMFSPPSVAICPYSIRSGGRGQKTAQTTYFLLLATFERTSFV